jgi:hypothetical protein
MRDYGRERPRGRWHRWPPKKNITGTELEKSGDASIGQDVDAHFLTQKHLSFQIRMRDITRAFARAKMARDAPQMGILKCAMHRPARASSSFQTFLITFAGFPAITQCPPG